MYIDPITTLGIAFMFLCAAFIYINWRLNKHEKYLHTLQTMFLASIDAMQKLASSHKDMIKVMEGVAMSELESNKNDYTKVVNNLKEAIKKNEAQS